MRNYEFLQKRISNYSPFFGGTNKAGYEQGI